MDVYMIRHTAVDVETSVCYGQTDVGLKDTFEQEAQVVKENLASIKADKVFSSPLSRCKRLAEYCGYTGIQFDDRLKEINFGDWEMQRWDNLDMSVWTTDWMNNPAPNGESFRGLADRVADFLEELKKQGHESVLIFTHGGVISSARVYMKLTTMEDAMDHIVSYGEITHFVV